MKKRSVLSILCLLLIVSGGCGRPQKYKTVVVDVLFTDEQFVLALPNKAHGAPGSFQLDEPLNNETLQDALPEGVRSTQLENGWLICTENNNGTKNQFYLHPLPNPESLDWNGYEIVSAAVWLRTSDHFTLSLILFPIQYLSDREAELFLDMDYEIGGTLEELAAFYQDCGWYDFAVEEEGLVISGYRQQPDWGSMEYSAIKKTDPFPLTIHYREEGEKHFIQIEYGGPELTWEEKYPENAPKPTPEPAE